MKLNSKILAAALVLAVVGGVGYTKFYAGNSHSMAGMANAASPSTKAYENAMGEMMKGMMVAPTGKPDLDFMQGMIPHHRGAVEMAKIILQFGKDPELKALAENVIKAQENEIKVIEMWLTNTDKNVLPTSPDSTKSNEAVMADMMQNMMKPYSGDADVDFARGMVPHHQGAIDAAKVALQYAKDPVVLRLAQDVTSAQQGEVAFLNDWLKRMGQ